MVNITDTEEIMLFKKKKRKFAESIRLLKKLLHFAGLVTLFQPKNKISGNSYWAEHWIGLSLIGNKLAFLQTVNGIANENFVWLGGFCQGNNLVYFEVSPVERTVVKIATERWLNQKLKAITLKRTCLENIEAFGGVCQQLWSQPSQLSFPENAVIHAIKRFR